MFRLEVGSVFHERAGHDFPGNTKAATHGELYKFRNHKSEDKCDGGILQHHLVLGSRER